VLGAAYGAFWSLQAPLIRDRFGTKAFGKVCVALSTALPIASVALAKEMASTVYKSHSPPHSTTCVGHQCFRTSFLVCAVLCGFSSLVACVIWHRYRPYYTAEAKLQRTARVPSKADP
jgi:hypothetical protein